MSKKDTTKILQICYAYPPLFSGYGKQLETINKHLTQNNSSLEFTVLTSQSPRKQDNTKINIISPYIKREKTKWGLYTFCSLIPLKAFLFYKSDLIHSVKAGPEAAVAIMMAKAFKKPTLTKIVGDDLSNKNNSLFRHLRIKTILLSTAIVALNSSTQKKLLDMGYKGKILRINNCVDTETFTPSDATYAHSFSQGLPKEPGEPKTILFMGSMRRRKGIYDLAESIQYLPDNLHIKLVFIGPEDEDNTALEESLEKHTSNKMVQYEIHPVTASPEKYIPFASVLTLPSYEEGMPNVVLQAISSGVPVLLSDIPPHLDLISIGDIGETFKVGDPKDLSDKLIKLIRFKKPNKKQIRKLALEHFSKEKIASSYLFQYKHLTKTN